MKIYKQGATEIALNGQRFFADDQGVIEIPEACALAAAQKGFVDAKVQLAKQQVKPIEPIEVVAPAIQMPTIKETDSKKALKPIEAIKD